MNNISVWGYLSIQHSLENYGYYLIQIYGIFPNSVRQRNIHFLFSAITTT